MSMKLTDEQIEKIADRVAEKLREPAALEQHIHISLPPNWVPSTLPTYPYRSWQVT